MTIAKPTIQQTLITNARQSTLPSPKMSLRGLRKALGLTKADFAARFDVSTLGVYAAAENGKNPTLARIILANLRSRFVSPVARRFFAPGQ